MNERNFLSRFLSSIHLHRNGTHRTAAQPNVFLFDLTRTQGWDWFLCLCIIAIMISTELFINRGDLLWEHPQSHVLTAGPPNSWSHLCLTNPFISFLLHPSEHVPHFMSAELFSNDTFNSCCFKKGGKNNLIASYGDLSLLRAVFPSLCPHIPGTSFSYGLAFFFHYWKHLNDSDH